MDSILSKDEIDDAKKQISDIENKFSELCAERNCEIVKKNHIKTLGALNGNFSQTGMWKLKNQLVPKELDPPYG